MTVPDIVAHPLATVQKLYQQAGTPKVDGDWGIIAEFEAGTASIGCAELPCLNETAVEKLAHHSLVCYYGMVQDTLNPEYYVGAYQRPDGEWVTTKYSDPDVRELEQLDDHAAPVVWERRPIVLVPVPGLSHWAAAAVTARHTAPIDPCQTAGLMDPITATTDAAQQPIQARSQRPKRERSTDADTPQPEIDAERADLDLAGNRINDHPRLQLESEDSALDTDLAGDQGLGCLEPAGRAGAAGLDADEDGDASRPRTRRREDTDPRGDDVEAEAGVAGSGSGAAAAGPAGTGAGQQSSSPSGSSGGEEVSGSCIAYLYDNSFCPRLHEVVQVLGVVSHMPQLASLEQDMYGNVLESELASLELGSGVSGGGQGLAEGGAGAGHGGGNGYGVTAADRLTDEAVRAAHPPTSKVMRVHAILVRKLPSLAGPLTKPSGDATASSPASSATVAAGTSACAGADTPPEAPVAMLRERALGLLRLALGGDAVAAEYVLLQMLARATSRGDSAALGQLALNLSRCPTDDRNINAGQDGSQAACGSGIGASHSAPPLAASHLGRSPSAFASALHAAISTLVPLSVALPLSLEAFDGVSWGPQRDMIRERTLPSPLQLPPGTVALLDETVMAPGQFSEKGFKSFQALASVARRQELMYDFEATQHPVPVDLSLIVLTERSRSLLRDVIPLHLPLNATQPFPSVAEVLAAAAAAAATPAMTRDCPAASDSAAADGDAPMAPTSGSTQMVSSSAPGEAAAEVTGWGPVRAYLAAARMQEDYSLAEGVPTLLERFFVDARRADAAGDAANNAAAGNNAASGGAGGMSPEEFHMKLTLARLLVLSYGEKQLTRERWQQLLQLEHTREARLRVVA